MKSYNNLFNTYISETNICISVIKAARGKTDSKEVQYYLNIFEEPIQRMRQIQKQIVEFASDFHNAHHKPIEIYDGISRKKRTIIVPRFYQQIVHHMVVNTMLPIFQRGMYKHSYASIPKRGAHKGKKVIEKWIKKDHENTQYCLKMDIRKFFDSIPHDIILSKLRKIIRDDKIYNILQEIINVTGTDRGLPLGFYTSQWLANWYLQGLDHYIKEQLKAKYYIRYMDDMVVFGSNSQELHNIRKGISEYLNNELGLELKQNWQVFKFSCAEGGRFLDFMGFRFYYNRTTIRRTILYKAARKARKINKKEKPTIHDLKQFTSYIGWFDYTDSYDIYLRQIKPYVNIQKCKRRISNYDRRINQEMKKLHGMGKDKKRKSNKTK